MIITERKITVNQLFTLGFWAANTVGGSSDTRIVLIKKKKKEKGSPILPSHFLPDFPGPYPAGCISLVQIEEQVWARHREAVPKSDCRSRKRYPPGCILQLPRLQGSLTQPLQRPWHHLKFAVLFLLLASCLAANRPSPELGHPGLHGQENTSPFRRSSTVHCVHSTTPTTQQCPVS